jgi:hypothetical protein
MIWKNQMRYCNPTTWALVLFITGALGGFVNVQAQDQSGPDFIVPARPTVSNPAEFQKPGVLQLEVGYNANFRAPGIHLQQDMPLALRFAVSRRVLLEFDGDSPSSQSEAGVGSQARATRNLEFRWCFTMKTISAQEFRSPITSSFQPQTASKD